MEVVSCSRQLVTVVDHWDIKYGHRCNFFTSRLVCWSDKVDIVSSVHRETYLTFCTESDF